MPGTITIRFPIGLKLSLFVSLILGFSLSLITVLVSMLVSAGVRLTAENNNWTMNRWSAQAARYILEACRDESLLLIRRMDLRSREEAPPQELAAQFYRLNPDISCVAFIGVAEGNAPAPGGIMVNERLGGEGAFRRRFALWLENRRDDLEKAARGETILLNAWPHFGMPALVMFFPLPKEKGFSFSGAAVMVFSPSALEESVKPVESAGSAANRTIIVNRQGGALVHHEEGTIRSAASLAEDPLVKEALSSGMGALQTVSSGAGDSYFIAFQQLPDLDTVVITSVRASWVFSGIAASVRNIIFIGAALLFLSVIVMIFYSRTMSRPLRALIGASRSISEGRYETGLEVKTADEIGILTESFIAMGRGLLDFERFTNKAVVALAREGRLGRSGERKTVTVCFTMIRHFGILSRGMDPQSLVAFINRFLAAVVPCVTSRGGLVDKFLTQNGVVLMSVWGATESAGSPVADAFNCIRSVLAMRHALITFNRRRITRNETGPLVTIGCGINTGEVIAGQMGSEERMEYTVLGDTVNLASRIEEPNEDLDTDILVTENTWRLLEKYLLGKEMASLEIKGKSRPLKVFAVVNIRNAWGPQTLEEVRKLWEP